MAMDAIENRVEGVKDYNLERVIMLSDGVFAIALTLLTLELKVPGSWGGDLGGLWMVMWRPFLAYGVSFAVIAVYWMSHRRIFSRFARVDTQLTVLNFVFLGFIGLVPAVTNLMYRPGASDPSLGVYLGAMGAIGVAAALTFGYGAFLGRHLMKVSLSLANRVSIFLTLLFVPVASAYLAIRATQPGLHWLFLVMILAWAAARLGARLASRGHRQPGRAAADRSHAERPSSSGAD